MMTMKMPTDQQIDDYVRDRELKDEKVFTKFCAKLDPIQHLYLLQILLDSYSNSDLVEILDNSLELSIKEELGDLWNFRSANGIGE